jgi:hypothetical protein
MASDRLILVAGLLALQLICSEVEGGQTDILCYGDPISIIFR